RPDRRLDSSAAYANLVGSGTARRRERPGSFIVAFWVITGRIDVVGYPCLDELLNCVVHRNLGPVLATHTAWRWSPDREGIAAFGAGISDEREPGLWNE